MVVNDETTREGHSVTLVFSSKTSMKRFFAHAGLPWKGADNGILIVSLTDDESQTRLEIKETEKSGGD